nr:hypothetical protein [Halovivax sp. KZCA124]
MPRSLPVLLDPNPVQGRSGPRQIHHPSFSNDAVLVDLDEAARVRPIDDLRFLGDREVDITQQIILRKNFTQWNNYK